MLFERHILLQVGDSSALLKADPTRYFDAGREGNQMLRSARRACLKCEIGLVANVLILSAAAASEARCVTCSKPNLNVRCEIGKSDTVAALPFGPELLDAACVKAIKASYGAGGCHISRDANCIDWTLRRFSRKEAKRALLGEMSVSSQSEPPRPLPQAATPEPSVETPAASPPNILAAAWQKLLALITWH